MGQVVNTDRRTQMAITSANQISVVLSGGTVNLDPVNSLGGNPSSAPIANGVLNNLFDDITTDQSENGHEDYRCVYFFNDGETPVYDVQVYILEDFAGGATVELGIHELNETQRIQISGGPVSGGFMRFSYEGVEFDSTYDSNLGNWAVALQNTLNSLTNGDQLILQEVSVTAQTTESNSVIFDIAFNGVDAKRNHTPITYVSDSFTPSGITVSASVTQEGAPINTIAPDIGLETTPPGSVIFYTPDETSPITFPILRPEDGFPLWIKRIVTDNTTAVADDGFKLRFFAESLG